MTITSFTGTQLIPVNGTGPEDVVVDDDGQVYAGLDDGRIIRITGGGNRIDTVARVAGRPLGIELYGADELVVCASDHGLLAVTIRTGAVRTLVDNVAGSPILGCNNAAVGADGTVFFSDSSQRFPIPEFRSDMIERTGTGRVFRRDPDGTVTEVASGLQFANGVALAQDESFVVIAETTTCRLHRLWLSGERAGRREVFADGLSGYPDNASTGSDGLIWVAIPSPAVSSLPLVQRMPAAARSLVRRLPTSLQPSPGREVNVVAFDATGGVVRRRGGTVEGFTMLTGVRERGGTLYCGSLTEGAILTTDR
ncbi:SMP-30/gluconolactonase/LRE family protein [Haloechinothrix sp. YIM 98757]|uniref:SMP-30/gluconolactonase/LRE family protein n=1 Tax=Haloechinothrix aidingensis TaxID=2752311 RepID=A0A838ABW5_9PSEU|nr:SMP-30/gluconolactonase/LRE family protein [Haloechinothrix aidingensis]MBA0126685.1 SMP-30/gluconolactonase/LRE family protein [Haloechinothrix aidingensis]